MAAYWDHHARVDLDAYVEVVQAVKAEGLPVVLGLEVDYYQGRMDEVAELLAGYPFDVLLGSVHWLGRLALRRPRRPAGAGRVGGPRHRRGVGRVHPGHGGAGRLGGRATSSPIPTWSRSPAGCPAVPDEFYDRITEAAVRSGMAAELSSAGWRKPVGEEYPAPPLLKRFVEQRGAAHHGVGRPHPARRGRRADDLRELLAGAGVTALRAYRDRRRPRSRSRSTRPAGS